MLNAILKKKRADRKPLQSKWPLPFPKHAKKNMPSAEKDARFIEGSPDVNDQNSAANMDTIKIYFDSIKKYQCVTPEQEKSLAKRVRKGDKAARNRMIESNLRLVISMARRYMNRGLPLHDLIEEGNIGLIKAVEHFKPSRNCKFSTYATFWIKQALERAIINQANVVRLPIHVAHDIQKITRAINLFMAVNGRPPEINEVSEKTDLSGRYINKLNCIIRKTCPLEATLSEDNGKSLMDLIEDNTVQQPAEIIFNSIRSKKITEWLQRLDEKKRGIIMRRFGFDQEDPQTLDHIGSTMGVTRERIRQIEIKAISELRRMADSDMITSMSAI